MASCIKRADTYFGRRSTSQIREFWTLCILLMTVSETVMVETIPYSNIGLTHCLWICKMVWGLGPHFLLTNIPFVGPHFFADLFQENLGYYILNIKMTSQSLSNFCIELRAAGD